MSLGTNIKRLRMAAGLTQRELQTRCGWNSNGEGKNSRIANYENGSREPSLGDLEIIAGALKVERYELLDDQTETVAEEVSNALETGPDVTRPLRKTPVVGIASLGFDGFWHEMEFPVGHGDGYVEHPTNDQNAYALRVKGDSMYPAIRSGWLVVVEPNTAPVVGEYVMVKLKDGRSTVKELLWWRDGEYALQAVNGQVRLTVREDEVEAVHFVAAVVPPSRRRL